MAEIPITNAPPPAPMAGAPEGTRAACCTGRGLAFKLSALGLVVVSALAGTGLARWLRPPEAKEGPAERASAGARPKGPFAGWPKPDLVLVFTGQQNGYVLPCGCSKPQVGGLERRYNFLQTLKKKGWAYVAADLGDVPQKRGPVSLPNLQGVIKYRYSLASLKEMGYTAQGLGENEANLSFFKVLGEWALNDEPKAVAANLIDADTNFPEQVFAWRLGKAQGKSPIKVGVTAVVGPSVAGKIKALARDDKSMRFSPSAAALNKALAEMNGKVDLRVLLYQGPTHDAKRVPKEAVLCAQRYPQFSVVMALSEEDEPPGHPVEVIDPRTKAKSLVVSVGRKGKFVGVVGVYRTGNADRPFDLRYELVEMTEDYLTAKADEKGHPISALMEDYTKELKRDNYLAQYGQVPHLSQAMAPVKGAGGKVLVGPNGEDRPTFMGSEACKKCHKRAYQKWEKSGHAHAYQTLVDAKRPSLRQHDPECIVCHTVGFGYAGGFKGAEVTEKLKNVGCESCHGPGSIHYANSNDEEWRKRMSPWRQLPVAKRENAMDQMCQKCHDIDNDVTWINGGFKRKWPKVAH